MKSYSEDEILAAINGSFGIVSTVAKKLKCQWNTAKTYIDKYETAKGMAKIKKIICISVLGVRSPYPKLV